MGNLDILMSLFLLQCFKGDEEAFDETKRNRVELNKPRLACVCQTGKTVPKGMTASERVIKTDICTHIQFPMNVCVCVYVWCEPQRMPKETCSLGILN